MTRLRFHSSSFHSGPTDLAACEFHSRLNRTHSFENRGTNLCQGLINYHKLSEIPILGDIEIERVRDIPSDFGGPFPTHIM